MYYQCGGGAMKRKLTAIVLIVEFALVGGIILASTVIHDPKGFLREVRERARGTARYLKARILATVDHLKKEVVM